MGCLWCGKYSTQCKTIPSRPPEYIPLSFRLAGWSVHTAKFPALLPRQPALSWTHRKFYKGFRDNARSRKPGQPGQSDSCEEVLNSEVGSWEKIPCEQRFLSCMALSAYEVVRVAVTYAILLQQVRLRQETQGSMHWVSLIYTVLIKTFSVSRILYS